MRVWRICWARYSASAFTGRGSVLYSGRWNPVGVPMVYTSTSKSLAAMEFYVHVVGSPAPRDLVMMHADLPAAKGLIERLNLRHLPADWRREYSETLQKIGADWIASGRTLALEVPSVVVPGEWNVLLNPAHRAFAKVILGKPEAFDYDARMFGR